MDNHCGIAISVILTILLLATSTQSVNGLPTIRMQRQVDPDNYLSDATRVFRDGLDILGQIAVC